MSFPDSLTLTSTTPGVAAATLLRTKTDPEAVFMSADRLWMMKIRHQEARSRIRSNLQVTKNEVVADPYTTGRSIPISQVVNVTFDTPLLGVHSNAVGTLIGIHNMLAASSSALYDAFAAQQK